MSSESNVNPSLTDRERPALDSHLNLSDGHARMHDPLIADALARAGEIFRKAASADQSTLEEQFVSALERLMGFRFPRPPILSYSSSCLASLVGQHLGQGSRVLWPEPSFDNLRDLVTTVGGTIVPVAEDALLDAIFSSTALTAFDAVWLTVPNNPTGWTLNAAEYEVVAQRVADLKKLLILDHCFRGYSPALCSFDQYEILEQSGVSYFSLEDTGKLISTLDAKVGVLSTSEDLALDLSRRNSEVLLNVSPFILALLADIIRQWGDAGRLAGVWDTIAINRSILRASIQPRLDVVASGYADVPFEWIRFAQPSIALRFLEEAEREGLALLGGAGFYISPPLQDSPFIRIALARNQDVVRDGAAILRGIWNDKA